MEIILKNNSAYRWSSKKKISIRGYFYYEGQFTENDEMINIFNGIQNVNDLLNVLEKVNGFYGLVMQTDNYLYIATDRINSLPLYYNYTNGNLIVSDDFRYVIDSNSLVNESVTIEYLMTGYVTNDSTLINNVNQLLPGEILVYDIKRKKVETKRYYKYLPSDFTALDKEELVDELDRVHFSVFSRMVASLNGKQVVVPLSGGYDSRLILEMLRKLNYENVLCVTWGANKDWQVEIAETVAKELCYEWIFIKTRRKDWHDWFNNGNMELYNIISGMISSIPYIQENLVIEYLEKNEKIQSDCIFISGNSGDFVEGGHIPEELLGGNCNVNRLAELIYSKHYRLFNLINQEIKDKIIDRIMKAVSKEAKQNKTDFSSIYEMWEWQERQSKFVSNSIKSFEMKGYQWRLPLWDNEIMEFWSKVPTEYRCGRTLFYEYAEKCMRANIPKANPKLSKFTVYKRRLLDSRYGCYNGTYLYISSLFQSLEEYFDNPILDNFKRKPMIVNKFNGIIALWNYCYIKSNINNYSKRG
jgi:asparagine synthase (glutamine-hydrolysing)